MKYLGIDYGTKRIGIAISDEEGSFAFPHSIVGANEKPEEAIALLVQKESIVGIVIGDSRASNDMQNPLSQKTKVFAEKLSQKINTPIYFEQEGFSSFEAHRYQPKAGNRDDSAAAIILQRFLDKKQK